ncbi:MAG: hypothetical protein BV458_08785, partial [Thermoplasmata archaeon M9B2D]
MSMILRKAFKNSKKFQECINTTSQHKRVIRKKMEMKKTMMKKRVVCVVAALLLTTGVITAAAAELNKAGVDNSKQLETFPTEKMQRIMNQVRDTLGVCG